jgi:hypothetical protein
VSRNRFSMFLITRELRRQKLQRDLAPEHKIFRFIDHAHTAAAQLARDAVMGDGLADELGRFAHCRKWYAAVLGRSNATLDQRHGGRQKHPSDVFLGLICDVEFMRRHTAEHAITNCGSAEGRERKCQAGRASLRLLE